MSNQMISTPSVKLDEHLFQPWHWVAFRSGHPSSEQLGLVLLNQVAVLGVNLGIRVMIIMMGMIILMIRDGFPTLESYSQHKKVLTTKILFDFEFISLSVVKPNSEQFFLSAMICVTLGLLAYIGRTAVLQRYAATSLRSFLLQTLLKRPQCMANWWKLFAYIAI